MSLASEPAPDFVRVPAAPLLFALLVAAWWPTGAAYRSDDLLAVHYANDFWGCFADFVGPQYGLQGVAEFWRPLVTMSFALEGLFGADPFAAYLLNTLVHAGATLLVAWLGVRFFGPFRGFMAALLWGLAPTHIGTIFWAVGRVDVFATFFTLLTLVLMVRRVDGRGRGRMTWPLVALGLALMSKETAMVTPLAASLVAYAAARPGERLRGAMRTWPLWILLVVYVGYRFLLFGGVGGYAEGPTRADLALQWTNGQLFELTVWPSLAGLGRGFLAVLAPVQKLPTTPDWLQVVAYLPGLLALGLYFAARRRLLFPLCVLGFLGASLPMLHVWADADAFGNLRLFYLPSVSIALFLGGAGVIPAMLTLAAWVVPTVAWHRDSFEQFKDSRAIQQELRDVASVTDGPMFVAGLPRMHSDGTAIAFANFNDRICQPPFLAPGEAKRLFALRPLAQIPGARRVPFGEDTGSPSDRLPAVGLPFTGATTLRILENEPRPKGERDLVLAMPLADSRRFSHRVLAPSPIDNLEVRLEGGDLVETARLESLYREDPSALWIRCEGRRSTHARMTLFSADGYLSVLVPDHSETGTDGVLHVVDFLVMPYAENLTPAQQANVVPFFALEAPIALDLSTVFPVLIELGHFEEAPAGGQPRFVVEAANHEPLWLEFERSFCNFRRGRRD